MLPNDILQQAVPGNLRRADQFVRFLRRLVAHLQKRMSIEVVTQESPQAFLLRLLNDEEIDPKTLKFVSDRLRSLLRTLEVTDVQDFSPLMLIADFATQMGCQMYIKNSVTAITFVALGTSLPDTFASMAAARGDKYADNSIGNVTGSNSVNVFLGLGLGWLIEL